MMHLWDSGLASGFRCSCWHAWLLPQGSHRCQCVVTSFVGVKGGHLSCWCPFHEGTMALELAVAVESSCWGLPGGGRLLMLAPKPAASGAAP